MYDYYSVVTNSLPKFVCLREHFLGGRGGSLLPETTPPDPSLNNAYTPIFGLQPRDKVAMLEAKTTDFFYRRIYMKMEFSSQRREMLCSFLTTNLAAVKKNNRFSFHIILK